jgi:predicted DNA-binding protein
MPATRTQIYLTKEQRRRIDQTAEAQGLPMAEIVRRALDAYLDDGPDAAPALSRTFGAQPDADTPSRDGWSRG